MSINILGPTTSGGGNGNGKPHRLLEGGPMGVSIRGPSKEGLSPKP